MQRAGDRLTPELAWQCQLAVLAMLLTGLHQPPLRLGALRVLHAFDWLEGVECVSCG